MSLPIFLFRTMYPRRGEEWVSTHANWPLCLMLRIGMRETEPAVAVENNSPDNLQLIVPNLHRRYSGVTATNRMVAPKLAKMFRAAWLGPDAPDGIARMGTLDLVKLWRSRTPMIWHARRNNEMIVGVLLRSLGWPLKLVFTSAAQRHHSWITRWLITRMDAIIATNDISASFLKRDATVIPHGVDTKLYKPPVDRAAAFAHGLKKRIEAAGLLSRIVITGELGVEEVQRWYQRLTIYAFTSRNEGFGLTLIEAMSVGAALVAALEPLMRDPASAIAMGIRAQSRVLAKFSLDTEAAGIAKVYRSLTIPSPVTGEDQGGG